MDAYKVCNNSMRFWMLWTLNEVLSCHHQHKCHDTGDMVPSRHLLQLMLKSIFIFALTKPAVLYVAYNLRLWQTWWWLLCTMQYLPRRVQVVCPGFLTGFKHRWWASIHKDFLQYQHQMFRSFTNNVSFLIFPTINMMTTYSSMNEKLTGRSYSC